MTESDPAEAGASSALPATPHEYDPAINGHAAPGPHGPLVAPWLDNNLTDAKHGRHDGWTPARKRLFHETLAQVGVVSAAAQAAGMTAHSAYALRNRDPVFDAGWEAALLLARRRLADELYARAVNGCVEQIHRDGAIVAERHRYDNRLSMAVLTRLDARVDRAEARGDGGHHIARAWDAYLDALGEDRADDARALIDPAAAAEAAAAAAKDARHRELRELREVQAAADAVADHHDLWRDEHGDVWTNYPPPSGFDPVFEEGRYGDEEYRRGLTPEEEALAEAALGELEAEGDIDPDSHDQRDAFFDELRLRFPDARPHHGDGPDDDGDDGDDDDDDGDDGEHDAASP